jgi:multidrug efflux pump subunit AcrA (membrane-fusion protein)
MEEETIDVAVDTSTEVEEAPESNETVEEDTEVIKANLADALKAKAELTARAKRAEEELKTLKANSQKSKPNDPQLTEELKLIARGLSDEAIEQAKVIARGKGISLTEAIKDPLFSIYQKDTEEREKKEKAKLGASRGSAETQEEVKGFQSGATREEHIEAFNKAVGKK